LLVYGLDRSKVRALKQKAEEEKEEEKEKEKSEVKTTPPAPPLLSTQSYQNLIIQRTQFANERYRRWLSIEFFVVDNSQRMNQKSISPISPPMQQTSRTVIIPTCDIRICTY